eukprot:1152868-Pelagomonas_calceolata.AAC.1
MLIQRIVSHPSRLASSPPVSSPSSSLPIPNPPLLECGKRYQVHYMRGTEQVQCGRGSAWHGASFHMPESIVDFETSNGFVIGSSLEALPACVADFAL